MFTNSRIKVNCLDSVQKFSLYWLLTQCIMFSFVDRSKFVSPTLSEGFSEIVNVNFVPQFDKNSKHAVLYRHFLMEK